MLLFSVLKGLLHRFGDKKVNCFALALTPISPRESGACSSHPAYN